MATLRLTPLWRTVAATSIVLFAAHSSFHTASAQDALQNTSLRFVPADVAWYSASLRLGEQWDALVASRAYQRLMEHPWVALGVAHLRAEWENPENEELAAFKEWLDLPENQECLRLATDGLREELFLHGDGSAARLLMLWNRANRASQMSSFQAALSGGNPQQAQMRAMLETFSEHRDELVVPAIIVGMKTREAETAQRQIGRVETTLREALADQPQLLERLTREMIAGREFLVWRLDGSLIPWELLANEAVEEEQLIWLGRFAEIVSEKTAVLAVGVWDDYILFSLGPNTEAIERLGAEPLLVTADSFAPLRDAADERLVSIGYASSDFRAALNTANLQQFDDMAELAEQGLAVAGPFVGLPEDLQLELTADIRKLSTTIKDRVPLAGALLTYVYLVPQGYEGYTYDWTPHEGLDTTRPLPILQHVGGRPILAVAARRLYQPDQYTDFASGMRRVGYYVDRLAQLYMNDLQRAWYERFREEGTPLVHRFNRATSNLLLPALEDGQRALVIDAGAKAESWHLMMPPAGEPLPLPALAVVCGVTDAERLREAGGEYLAIAQEAADRLRAAVKDASESGDLPPEAAEQFPEIKLQPPQSRDVDAGTLYWYALPANWGLSERLAPAAGLSEDYVAFSLLPELSERLLKAAPLQAFGPLENVDRPLVMAVYFDFAALIEAARPWVGYIVALSQGVSPAEAEDDPTVATLKEQIGALLDVAACFRGVAAVKYREGDAFVTHAATRVEDLADSD